MRRVTSIDDYRTRYRFSLAEPAKFWAGEAECIDWFHPYAQVCDTDMREASFTWFAQGKLNAACIGLTTNTTLRSPLATRRNHDEDAVGQPNAQVELTVC